jgi:hypothetical protein
MAMYRLSFDWNALNIRTNISLILKQCEVEKGEED